MAGEFRSEALSLGLLAPLRAVLGDVQRLLDVEVDTGDAQAAEAAPAVLPEPAAPDTQPVSPPLDAAPAAPRLVPQAMAPAAMQTPAPAASEAANTVPPPARSVAARLVPTVAAIAASVPPASQPQAQTPAGTAGRSRRSAAFTPLSLQARPVSANVAPLTDAQAPAAVPRSAAANETPAGAAGVPAPGAALLPATVAPAGLPLRAREWASPTPAWADQAPPWPANEDTPAARGASATLPGQALPPSGPPLATRTNAASAPREAAGLTSPSDTPAAARPQSATATARRVAPGIPLRPRAAQPVPAPGAEVQPPALPSPILPPAPPPPSSPQADAPVARRLAAALEPTLLQAQALSIAAARGDGGAVNNVFNVSITLQGGTAGAQAIDPLALEQALSDLLYAAARRHGLEL